MASPVALVFVTLCNLPREESRKRFQSPGDQKPFGLFPTKKIGSPSVHKVEQNECVIMSPFSVYFPTFASSALHLSYLVVVNVLKSSFLNVRSMNWLQGKWTKIRYHNISKLCDIWRWWKLQWLWWIYVDGVSDKHISWYDTLVSWSLASTPSL